MAKKHWGEQEKLVLSNNISHGILVSDLFNLIPSRSKSGIIRIAQTLNFGTKTKDGVTKFYAKKKTRSRTKKNVKSTTIVGERRTAPTVQEPTEESRTTSLSNDSILAKEVQNSNALQVIYNTLNSLLDDDVLNVKSLTAIFKNATLTLSKETA